MGLVAIILIGLAMALFTTLFTPTVPVIPALVSPGPMSLEVALSAQFLLPANRIEDYLMLALTGDLRDHMTLGQVSELAATYRCKGVELEIKLRS